MINEKKSRADIQGYKKRLSSENDKPESILKPDRINPTEFIGAAPKREWIIKDWLPRGYITALCGDGGLGKSLLAQQLATCLVVGNPWLDIATSRQRVYALMCTEDENELWRRQIDINEIYGLDMKDLSNLRLVSRVGCNNLMVRFDGRDSGKHTQFFEQFLSDIKTFNPDLVILDAATDLFGGNESNYTQVRQFIQSTCGTIAKMIDGAVLLCVHPYDLGIQRDVYTNNVIRSSWHLMNPKEAGALSEERVLIHKKSNYSAEGEQIYMSCKHSAFRRIYK